MNLVEILKDCPKGTKLYTSVWGEVTFIEVEDKDYEYPICIYTNTCTKVQLTKNGCFISSADSECILFPSKEQRDWSKFSAPWYKKETGNIDNIEKQYEQTTPQTNERAWLYLISDILTWKDGIGQYLDDPRVQELAKKLCSKYSQELYNPSNTKKDEQKSADKIEPKFKVGDWIAPNLSNSSNLLCIIGVDETNYEVVMPQGSTGVPSIKYIDEHYHLWTIQDAKDGDVLANNHHILILKKLVYDWSSNGTPYSVKAYCGIKPNGNFEIGKDNWCFCGTLHILPATKEQCDLLFQKMKEADYEWDADKKELKKLVKPKFKVGDKIVNVPKKYMGASGTQGIILKVTEDKYIFTDGSYMHIGDQDIWELVIDKKTKFDPKTLKPFDKVLVRDLNDCNWVGDLFLYIKKECTKYPYKCIAYYYRCCIPYNDDTKHLLGTNEEAPEYYRYWED